MTQEYTTPQLPYGYDALEPHIDEQTMRLHHDKHHAAYTAKLNAAVAKHPELYSKKPEELLKDLSQIPEDIRTAVRNNGGGHVNHELFWNVLKKGVKAHGKVVEAIAKQYGSLEEFKKKFTEAAATQFGSGWAWLVKEKDGTLSITSTPNQDTPLSQGKTPLLALDVWEHSFYLKWRSDKAGYINSWWNVVNWEYVNGLYEGAFTK